MQQSEYIISAEIGSSAVKIAAAESKGPGTPLNILAVTSEPISSGVRYGRIQNVEDVTTATMLALQTLIDNPALSGRKIVGVYAGIGGRSLASISVSARLTLPDEQEITAEIIERLKEDALADVPTDVEPLEIIPVSFTIDGIKANRPVGSYGTSISADFTIVVCDPINARNIERVIVKKLNLDICGYVVRPLAVAKLALTVHDTKPGVMLADIGAETTTVSIFKGGSLRYLATIPMGSRNITRDLAQGLGIIEEKAEDIKRRLGNAMPDQTAVSAEQTEIDNYVQARAAEIVANIVAHIGFSGLTTTDLRSGIVVTGRGAKLRNLCQLLKQQSQLEVRIATLPAQIRIADPLINSADNLDIIASAVVGSTYASAPDAIPCTVETEPEAATEEESDDDSLDKNDSIEIDTTPVHNGQRNVDDEDLLIDDDEAERRAYERERDKAERERKKAEEKAADKIRDKNSNIFSKIRSSITRMVNSADTGDGNDLDD